MSTKPILSCLLCKRRYSEEDVRHGLYWPQTYICSRCYGRMQAAPYEVSCFGKPTEVDMCTGRKRLGYDSRSLECNRLCPDRDICALVFAAIEEEEDTGERSSRMGR